MAGLNASSPALLSEVLIADNAAPCISLCNKLFTPVVDPIQPGDSKTSCITFYDSCIGRVLIPMVESNRELDFVASTGSNRPEYLLNVDSVYF